MQNHFLLLCLFVSHSLFAQEYVPISSTGIGAIKIGGLYSEISPLLEAKQNLKVQNPKGYARDTLTALYNDITVTMTLEAYSNSEDQWEWRVQGLDASDPKLKTKSGITLGTPKMEVVQKLESLRLSLMPDWRYEDQKDAKRYSLVILNDWDNGTELTMYFTDNLLVGFAVSESEGC